MSWNDLLFMHWPVPEEALRPWIPPALRLDAFDGSAWLGITPFRMSGTRPRSLPSFPPLSDFPELNVRTYVTAEDKPGIWFFSLDASNTIAVRLARATFSLPYFDAEMSCRVVGEEVRYRSVRTHRDARALPDRALLSLQREQKGQRLPRRHPPPSLAPAAGRARGGVARHDGSDRRQTPGDGAVAALL
jgi:uncharacterized protein YqjF (DUF2071 family)